MKSHVCAASPSKLCRVMSDSPPTPRIEGSLGQQRLAEELVGAGWGRGAAGTWRQDRSSGHGQRNALHQPRPQSWPTLRLRLSLSFFSCNFFPF